MWLWFLLKRKKHDEEWNQLLKLSIKLSALTSILQMLFSHPVHQIKGPLVGGRQADQKPSAVLKKKIHYDNFNPNANTTGWRSVKCCFQRLVNCYCIKKKATASDCYQLWNCNPTHLCNTQGLVLSHILSPNQETNPVNCTGTSANTGNIR